MRRGLTARARTIAAAAMMLGGALAAAGAARPAAAATPHYARADSYSTGWYPDQPRLAPGIVSGGTFGRLFSAPVRGQVVVVRNPGIEEFYIDHTMRGTHRSGFAGVDVARAKRPSRCCQIGHRRRGFTASIAGNKPGSCRADPTVAGNNLFRTSPMHRGHQIHRQCDAGPDACCNWELC